jgi:acetyl-CoA carboxylase carboxyltransferase component
MTKPNKSEQGRINALRRELTRKYSTTLKLENDLIIAGRDYDPYINTLREARTHLDEAIKALERICEADKP